MKKDEHNCRVDLTEITPTEKNLEVPPRKFAIEMSTGNVREGETLTINAYNHTFDKGTNADGTRNRIDEKENLLAPITNKKFEKILKLRQKLTARENANTRLEEIEAPVIKLSDDDFSK